MKFSVIIPAYNNGDVISKTVSSVLMQTFADFEILIVDDGSTDKTKETIQKNTDSKIKYFRLEKNSGVHVARNTGIENAKGEYLVFLDADDEMFSDCLEELNKAIEDHPEAGFYSAPCVTNTGVLTGIEMDKSGFVKYEDFLCQRLTRRIKQGVPCVRADLSIDVRFVAPNLDFIYYRYIIKKANSYYISKPLAKYNLLDTPSAQHIVRKVPNISKSIIRGIALDKFLKDFEDDYLQYCPIVYARCSYGAALGLILNGNYLAGIKRSKDVLVYAPFKFKYLSLFLLSLFPGVSTAVLRIAYRFKKFMLTKVTA